VTTGGLYKATDGSWQQAEARVGVRLLYTLKPGERWALLDDDRVMVVHSNRPPKVVYPDGRVEEDRANTNLTERIGRDAHCC
jgi:hypothetical protein